MTTVISDLVSTIIPVYNRPKMVRKAVNSVLEQNYRPIEIILVNDGSTDNSGEVLDGLAAEYPEEIIVIHQQNGGAGLAREAGRMRAHGEYIQYLDSDDWLLPHKFTDQVAALKANPDCGIAYGITRLVNEQGEVLKEPSKWTGKKIDYLFPLLLIDRWWHTHTPLYRRTVSDAAGAWPKRRPEDWDLEARMGAERVKLVYCKSVVSCHLCHPSLDRVSRGNKANYFRDEAWFLPRLYSCAVQAGIDRNSEEMQHFSRWAFVTARRVGALGESKMAWELLRLSKKSGGKTDKGIEMTAMLARIVGWKLAGKWTEHWGCEPED